MSNGFKSALLYLAVIALCEVGALYVMEHYERAPARVWKGYSEAARNNDFLALQRMILKLGRPARNVASLYAEELPPADGAIIVPITREHLSEQQHQRLLSWVAQGGDLFVTVSYNEMLDKDDPILLATGVRRLESLDEDEEPAMPGDYITVPPNWVLEDEEYYADDEEAEPECGVDGCMDPEGEDDEEAPAEVVVQDQAESEPGILVHVPGEARDFRATLNNGVLVGTPGGWQVPGEMASFVVREPWGQGTITVLSSSWFMMNHAIGDVDNAELAWSLLRTTDSQGPVWIVYGIDAPALWDTIRAHWWQVLAAIALLALAVVWRFLPRVGAPIAPLPIARRELLEHVEASGRFLVDHASSHVLLESVQKQARKKILKRFPQLAALPEREKRARLAAVAKLSQSDIDVLYRPHVGLNRNDFVTVQRQLERIIQSS